MLFVCVLGMSWLNLFLVLFWCCFLAAFVAFWCFVVVRRAYLACLCLLLICLVSRLLERKSWSCRRFLYFEVSRISAISTRPRDSLAAVVLVWCVVGKIDGKGVECWQSLRGWASARVFLAAKSAALEGMEGGYWVVRIICAVLRAYRVLHLAQK